MAEATAHSESPVPTKARVGSKITWGPIAAIVGSVVIYFGSQIFGSLIVLGLATMQGLSGDQVTAWLKQTGPQFLYILAVEATALGALWLFLRHRKSGFRTLGLVKPRWRDVGYGLLGFGVYFPILLLTTVAIRAWFPQVNLDQEQQIGFEAARGFWPLVLVFISLVVLPPIAEEILNRGFLYLGLKSKLPKIWAVILTSLIFAVAHLQFGSGAPLLWSAAIDTFILSLVLIYVREVTGALWASIGLHMLKNGVAFLALFIFAK